MERLNTARLIMHAAITVGLLQVVGGCAPLETRTIPEIESVTIPLSIDSNGCPEPPWIPELYYGQSVKILLNDQDSDYKEILRWKIDLTNPPGLTCGGEPKDPTGQLRCLVLEMDYPKDRICYTITFKRKNVDSEGNSRSKFCSLDPTIYVTSAPSGGRSRTYIPCPAGTIEEIDDWPTPTPKPEEEEEEEEE